MVEYSIIDSSKVGCNYVCSKVVFSIVQFSVVKCGAAERSKVVFSTQECSKAVFSI